MTTRRLAGVLCVAFAAAAAGDEALAAPPDVPHAPAPQPSTALLKKLQIVFGTSGPVDAFTDDKAPPAEHYRAFVRAQMAQNAFYDAVMRRLFTLLVPGESLLPFVLHKAKIGGREAYVLGEGCAPKDLVQVKPWWDLKSQVWICKDDYRPEVTTDTRTGTTQYCDASQNGTVDPICRCGAQLLNCARDEDQANKIAHAQDDEVLRTMQHVIQKQQPFSEIFATNETMRTDYAERFYARARYYFTGKLDYPTPREDDAPTWRPRDPAFDGGVLSTPHFVYADVALRTLLSDLWADILCIPFQSSHVDSATLAKVSSQGTLASGNLRTREHMALAEQVGCRDCHARLEYGMRFFYPFSNARVGVRLIHPTLSTENTRFYGRDSGDMRAEGPATMGWLGQMLGKQPEFKTCMVTKVESWIFAGDPVPAKAHAHFLEQFGRDQNFARLVEDATVAHFAGLDGAAPPGDRR